MNNEILEAEKNFARAQGMLYSSVVLFIVILIGSVIRTANPVTIDVNCTIDTTKQTTLCNVK
jgi:hypothetical protein